MKKNNFKELEELELEGLSISSDKILNGISADIGILRYISEVVELYFPKIIDLFVGLAGANTQQDK
ncbi:MAG: hypothetical protein V3V14_12960 [Saprospiraceae bacterium]